MDTQERTILYNLLTAAVILGVLLFVFLRNLNKHYKRNQRLHKQLTLVEIQTLENERRRILADLHDEFAPLLTTTKLLVSNLTIVNDREGAIAAKAMGYTDTLLQKLKQISFDLMPSSLTRSGLAAAIHEHVTAMNSCGDIVFTFDAANELSLAADVELHIFRIIHEAMNNVIKYAEATQCSISITEGKHHLTLKVSDNGKGFKARNTSGNGLNNMALRSEVMNGKFYLESKPGAGTHVTIEIPLKEIQAKNRHYETNHQSSDS